MGFIKRVKKSKNHEVCNLQCEKQPKTVIENFDGPVKIVIVDPPEDENDQRATAAACIAISSMMIGAITAVVMFFTLSFKLPTYINSHILICTFGYQFCIPQAILMLHSLHGPAAPLTESQRLSEHIYLHLFGLAIALIGSYVAIQLGEPSIFQPSLNKKTTLHYYVGCVTAVVSTIACLSGFGRAVYEICLGNQNNPTSVLLVNVHRYLGMVALVVSAICLVTGILKPSVMLWLFLMGYASPTYIIMFFIAFYTLIIIFIPGSRFTAIN